MALLDWHKIEASVLLGTDVARKAKQLSFGFEAAAFLKADTISYAAKAKDFNKYFR